MAIKPDSDFSSPGDIQNLLARLEEWQGQLHQAQMKRRLNLPASSQLDQHLARDLRKLHISVDLEQEAALDEAINLIKDWVETAPVIHITFSAPPGPGIKKAVVEWLHKEIDPQILVQIQVDGGIAAGFIVRTKNRVLDFTANEVLWQNRAHIAELVKHV